MIVVKSEDNLIEFSNGLKIIGDGDEDCCAYNYLDFEQFPVGTEFEDMDMGVFLNAITLKDDGFSIKDKYGVPKWAQARSDQNGYYSNITRLVLEQNEKRIICKALGGDISGE